MEPKRPFAQRAGWSALWLAFAAIVLCLVPVMAEAGRAATPSAYGLTLVTLASLGVFLCLVVSVVCGLVALCGIRKHGRKGILAPAVAGLMLATLLLIPILLRMASAFTGASHASSSPLKAREVATNQLSILKQAK